MQRLPQFGFPGGPTAPPYADLAAPVDLPGAAFRPPLAPDADLAAAEDRGGGAELPAVVLRAARPPAAHVAARLGASVVAIVALAAAAARSAPPLAAVMLAGIVALVWLVLVTATALVRPAEVRLVGHWVGVRSPFGQYTWCDLSTVHSVASVDYATIRPRARNGTPVAIALWSTTPHGSGMSKLVARRLAVGRPLPGLRVASAPPLEASRPFLVPCGELDDPTPLLAALERYRPQ